MASMDGRIGTRVLQIFHRGLGRDHRGGQVRQERETGGEGGVEFPGAVEQAVVGAAVQGQGLHHLGIDLAIEVEHPGGQQQGQGRQGVGIDDGDGRDVETGGGDVIAADGGGMPGPQPLLLLDRPFQEFLGGGLVHGQGSDDLSFAHA